MLYRLIVVIVAYSMKVNKEVVHNCYTTAINSHITENVELLEIV